MSARDDYCCQGSESTYVVARAVCAPGKEAQRIAISDNRRYAADVTIARDCRHRANLGQTVISKIVHTLKVDRRNKLGVVELGRDATTLQGPSHAPACRRICSDGVLGGFGAHLENRVMH